MTDSGAPKRSARNGSSGAIDRVAGNAARTRRMTASRSASVHPGSASAQAAGRLAKRRRRRSSRRHPNSARSAAPGSGARMKASPTRNACTSASRIRCTSARPRMPPSVTSSRSAGTCGQQRQGRFQRDFEASQVAVVDADQRRRAAAARASSSAPSCTSTSTAMPSARRLRLEVGQLGVVEAGRDQQDAVGPHRPRLEHLVGVDDEVLAQHRQRAGRTRLLEKGRCALEELGVGQHAQAARHAARSWRAISAGLKCSRSTPLLGLAFLISAITAAAPAAICARRLATKSRCPPSDSASRRSEAGSRRGLRGRDLLALDGNDRAQDVAQPKPAPWLRATNWSIFARALPEASASRASTMPSAIVAATIGRIQRHAGIEDHDVARRAGLVVEHRLQQHLALLGRLDLECAVARHRQAEVLGVDLVLAGCRRS